MSLVCPKCGGDVEEKTTTIQTNVDKLTLSVDGIQLYVCRNCDDITLEANDAKIIQMLKHAFEPISADSKHPTSISEDCTDVLNLQEVASLLRVSHQTVYNMIKDKRLKGYKVGREWRFLKKDIAEYIPITSNAYPKNQEMLHWTLSNE